MQIVELELSGDYEFFCPATSEQIIYAEAPFEASSATVFCYLENINQFEFAEDWVKEKFIQANKKRKEIELETKNIEKVEKVEKVEKPVEIIHAEKVDENKSMLESLLAFAAEESDEPKTAFEMFLDGLNYDLDYDNLICFSITTGGTACGPSSFTVHIGIDMTYKYS